MSLEIGIVLVILAVSILLFVSDKYSPDLVALFAVLALLLSRTLDTADALAGFGNPAVITIAFVFLVTAGLTNTGIAAWIGRHLFRIAGENEGRLVAVTMAASALLSLFMNNIASASVLLPGLTSIARRTRISSSKLLIPLSFGTLLGGMATLFTTVNILANDALHRKGLAPFTLWDFFRIGSLLTIAGIAFMALLGRKLLPDYPAKEISPVRRFPEDLARLYRISEQMFEARILAGSPLDGKTAAASHLGHNYGLNILGILRGALIKLAPGKDEILRAGDRLIIEGEVEVLQQTQEGLGLVLEPKGAAPDMVLADRDVGVAEIVISPHADVVGRSLRDIHFREKFGLAVLALLREGQPVKRGVPDVPLRVGDALLVQGPRARLELLRAERNFIILEEPEYVGGIARPDKAPWALLGMLLMLLLAGLGLLSIAAAALLGAVVMVVSGALKMEEGYQAIEWKAVVMIGGMLSMGTALEKSGAATLISHSLLHVLGPLGPAAVMAGFFVLSMFLAQVLSGAATVVLMAPIALSTAMQLQVSAHPLLMTVVLGASCAFLTPVSHPANVLVMGPGGYRFVDYARVGGYLTLIVFLLVMVLVPRFWPF
ncbi:MAG: SLC13 family permease [Acidobacteriia bacterium]|nr:SLC13 family permease [Terriglobia bacterium]